MSCGNIVATLVLAGFVFLLSSCGQQSTVITGVTYYPEGASYNNASNWMVVEAKGEAGQAYSSLTPKKVTVAFFLHGNLLTNFQYRIVAHNLDWKVKWTNISNIGLVFYDRNNSEHSAISNLSFVYHPEDSLFFEGKLIRSGSVNE
jgi:hypothetical protein